MSVDYEIIPPFDDVLDGRFRPRSSDGAPAQADAPEPTVGELLPPDSMEARLEEARVAEREACAAIADVFADDHPFNSDAASFISERIRKRGETHHAA